MTSIATPDVDPVSTDGETPATFERVRRAVFYVVAVGTLALAGLMIGGELLLAFTGWTTDMGIHQVHDMVIFPMLWLAVVLPVATLLYRPTRRVTTVLTPSFFLLPLAVMAVAIDSPIAVLPLLFGVLGVVLFVLHPAGQGLLSVDRVERPSRLLAGLVAVAAVPLLVFAGDQLFRQLTISDDHTLFVHYGAMAIAAAYVVVMGSFAVLRERDWRFAAWSAGAVAVLLGANSIAFTAESSAGPLWGGLAVVWGIAFVAATEYARQSTDEQVATREPETETAPPA